MKEGGLAGEEAIWLTNKAWRDNRIASNAKTGLFVMWGFALLWNLISLPIFFADNNLLQEVQRKPETAFVFLFPLIGVVLIILAVRALNNWRRFGKTPLVLDPFPGSISGHVGGRIECSIPYEKALKYRVSLSCIHSYMSGTGKNRSRKESLQWQSEGVCLHEPCNTGTALSFRFDVPNDLPESDLKKASAYYLWRVSVQCELPGTDFDRQFEIPVFGGQRFSQTIEQGTEEFQMTIDEAHEGLSDIAQINPIPGGLELYFPAFKRPMAGIMALVLGLIFGGAGIVMAFADDVPILFPILFTPIGLGILSAGVWGLGKSLHVRIDREHTRSRRFFMGYPMTTKSTDNQHVTAVKLKEGASVSSGNKTTVYYQLELTTQNHKPIIIAERLTSKPEAELMKDTLEPYYPNSLGN